MPVPYHTNCLICGASFDGLRRVWNRKHCAVCARKLKVQSKNHIYKVRQKNGTCLSCGAPRVPGRSRCPTHLESFRDWLRQGRRKLRAKILTAYGCRCACCGETRKEFLAIDHIHGRSAEERKARYSFTAAALYQKLQREGFPTDNYRLLCHNCNCARGFYGYCPHELEREARSRPKLNFIANAFDHAA